MRATVLVGLHLPFVIAPPVYVISRHPDLTGAGQVAIVAAALALGALQLRHGLAAVQRIRPRGWPLTLAAVALLAYGPSWRFSWDWADTQWFVLASVTLLLRGRTRLVLVAAIVAGNAGVFASTLVDAGGDGGEVVFWTVYWLAIVVMGGVALDGSVRLVRVAQELQAARLELADAAVGRERQRVSRDLHDVLGQSLSAVSLKGDLALRLLDRDAAAARAEIRGLTELARGALRDVRAVAHDRHAVSLRREVDAATTLLAAAGVATRVEVGPAEPGGAAAEVLAWAVREGTTNLLRHSEARTCWIRAGHRGGAVRLEILNDGARGPMGQGTGLVGLAQRAAAVAGSVHAARLPDGRFRLVVEVPA